MDSLEASTSSAQRQTLLPSFVLPARQAPVVGKINRNNLVVFVNAIVLQNLHVVPKVA